MEMQNIEGTVVPYKGFNVRHRRVRSNPEKSSFLPPITSSYHNNYHSNKYSNSNYINSGQNSIIEDHRLHSNHGQHNSNSLNHQNNQGNILDPMISQPEQKYFQFQFCTECKVTYIHKRKQPENVFPSSHSSVDLLDVLLQCRCSQLRCTGARHACKTPVPPMVEYEDNKMSITGPSKEFVYRKFPRMSKLVVYDIFEHYF
ncbi:unnamed protein product [Owenia fusiformis]|uniref:Uncharacterized protein n=1 Tax=Owenia fusiformis TaxID=6347 RepID=A0A8S4Q2L2_OWEFU|nr:unnamed protein product [Owenia fusiformis]